MSDGRGTNRISRRVVILLIVLVLAVLGAGIGSFVLNGDDGRPGVRTPTPTPTPTPTDRQNVSLTTGAETQLLNASDVTPGTRGTRSVTFRNVGPDTGALSIATISLNQSENGLTDPEAAVDDSNTTGELGRNLLVTVTFVSPNGERVPLYGTADGPRPLRALPSLGRSADVTLAGGQAARLEFDWRLPHGVGNVVQSDSVDLNATIQLRAAS
ncbi:MAG: hypothetical protein ABEI57_02995 [Halapricum sp.]